jgi:hypothetical protein
VWAGSAQAKVKEVQANKPAAKTDRLNAMSNFPFSMRLIGIGTDF